MATRLVAFNRPEILMQNYYVRFGRRHPLPSTAEILDELRADYVPSYVRKSMAQYGFKRPELAAATPVDTQDTISRASIARTDQAAPAMAEI